MTIWHIYLALPPNDQRRYHQGLRPFHQVRANLPPGGILMAYAWRPLPAETYFYTETHHYGRRPWIMPVVLSGFVLYYLREWRWVALITLRADPSCSPSFSRVFINADFIMYNVRRACRQLKNGLHIKDLSLCLHWISLKWLCFAARIPFWFLTKLHTQILRKNYFQLHTYIKTEALLFPSCLELYNAWILIKLYHVMIYSYIRWQMCMYATS